MWKQILILILITFVPALELRASIPWGILGHGHVGIEMSWPIVVLVCMAANILLGWGVFWVLAPIMKWLERFTWFRKWIEPVLFRAQRKIHPYVEKYGEMGIAVFIGVPLPGSGVYTGAVGAFLLGLDRRKFAVANVIGVLIAGTAVTLVCLAIDAGRDIPFSRFLIKHHDTGQVDIQQPLEEHE